MGVFFNGQIKAKGKHQYSLYAESYLALLDYDFHYGGIYLGALVGDVIAGIMGGLPYTIHPDVAALRIYGYLPYATKRENLLQVLLATGAAIARNANGTMHFTVLTSVNKGTFSDGRVFMAGSLDEDTLVTAVQVTEHAYAAITDEVTLFAESFTDIRLATFSEPAHDLVCTNGTILESGANYARIQGAGAVTLTGKKYRHTTKIVTRGNVIGTPDDKILSVTNATLITAINSSSVAQRLYSYAKCNKSIRQDSLINAERTGDIVQVVHPYGADYLSAAIHSLDFSMSNTLRAAGEFLVGYEPQGISEGYKNRVLLTSNGNWTVPAGVTEIRAILIGGGTGGQAGKNGTAGGNGTNRINTSVGAGGKGGDGGEGGEGGKVYDTTLTVTPGQVLARTIGTGGTGGTVSGSNGFSGTATTFGAISSNLGAIGDYVDAMTAERFSFIGNSGIKGGNGGGPGQAQYVIGPDGTVYTRGIDGDIRTAHVSGGGTIGGMGGEGGGAAVGDNGDNGGDGNATGSSGGFADGGNGGRGGDAIAGSVPAAYGAGGNGGHGGGGGGGGGDCYHWNSSNAWPGSGGSGGNGGSGGAGAQGCIIIYY
jgi:hypothetical protein